MTRLCEFSWVVGNSRHLACDGEAAAIVTMHRFVGRSQQRVRVCDRHIGSALAVLDAEADMPLEVTLTAHGKRLFAGAVAECFPTLDLERAGVVAAGDEVARRGTNPGSGFARPERGRTRRRETPRRARPPMPLARLLERAPPDGEEQAHLPGGPLFGPKFDLHRRNYAGVTARDEGSAMSTVIDDSTGVVSGMRFVPVDELRPSPWNRPVSDESVDELVPSVMKVGVLLPLLVRRHVDGVLEIVAGERRWRAACKAGVSTVPVVEHSDFDDRQRELEAATVENLCRTAYHPLDEGRRFAELVELGQSQSALAKFLGHGWTQPTISNRVLVVAALARLDDDLAAAVEDVYRRDGLTVRQAEDLARKVVCYASDDLYDDLRDDVAAVVRQIVTAAEPAVEEARRRHEVDGALHRAARVVKQLAEVRKERQALAEAGIRDVTDEPADSYVPLSSLSRELGDSMSTHSTLPCHAAYVWMATTAADWRVVEVCTDPDSHRIDEPDETTARGDQGAATSPAATSPSAGDQVRAEAAQRRERWEQSKEREARVVGSWPARRDVVKASLGRTRGAGKVLVQVLEQIVRDVVVEDLADELVELLDLDLDETSRDDIGEVLAAYIDESADQAVRFGAAFAAALAEYRLRNTARIEDVAAAAGDRAVCSYLDLLVENGHDLSDDERMLHGTGSEPAAEPDEEATAPEPDVQPAVVDEPPGVAVDEVAGPDGAADDVEPHPFVDAGDGSCVRCHEGPLEDVHYDEAGFPLCGTSPELASVAPAMAEAWLVYSTARVDLIADTKSVPLALSFDSSKAAFAVALADGAPDRSELEAVLSLVVGRATALAAERDGGADADEVAAGAAAIAEDVLAVLGPVPSEFGERVRSGFELVPWERPATNGPGQNRHLYLDDLLDAVRRSV